jgi:hypothetical protein
MNERIKKLYNQSLEEKYQYGGSNAKPDEWYSNYITVLNAEKFAQLIVKECANHCDLLLDHKISSEWSRGTHDCSRAIKQHFGVEE